MQSKLLDRLGRPMKHGMHKTPEHLAWAHMKDRCRNPNSQRYDRYGGRGIKVCRRWQESFLAFYEDMGPRPSPRHSLERLDNDGDYEPGNVIWALPEAQNSNKSTNHIIEHDGLSLTLTQWSKRLGIHKRTLLYRLQSGWTVIDALTTPVESRTWVSSAGNRLSKETKTMIVAARLAGRTCKEVAEQFGVCAMTVSKLSRKVDEPLSMAASHRAAAQSFEGGVPSNPGGDP